MCPVHPCATGLLGDISQNCRGICHLVVPEEDGDTTPIHQTFKGPDDDGIFPSVSDGTHASPRHEIYIDRSNHNRTKMSDTWWGVALL